MIRSFKSRRPDIFRLAAAAIVLPLSAAAADRQGAPSRQDASPLFGACYSRAYDAARRAEGPGQRIAAIAVQFQGFEGALLASVTYRLRYGTTFGFSSDCHEEVEGGFLCRACVGATCGRGGERFKILWSGEGGVEIVNDMTGMLGENPAGGRDYLISRDELENFRLRRGPAEDCVW